MANLNKVLLMGNLTRDVEMRFTPSGMALAQFGLATNRKFRDSKTNEMREEVTFVDIEVWGKQAETANQYLSKGRPVFIEGRLKLDTWDDKQTGQKRSKMKVVAERIQFLGGGGGAGGQGGQGAQGGGAPRAASRPQQSRQAPPAPDQDMGGQDAPPEDLDIQEDSVPF
ncbi:MAG TPA: single-stranded DNA-binding protein [Planctomycetota bacterium]|nr:single-stranded DNA-binding protein [Planctomycetota bacterium]